VESVKFSNFYLILTTRFIKKASFKNKSVNRKAKVIFIYQTCASQTFKILKFINSKTIVEQLLKNKG